MSKTMKVRYVKTGHVGYASEAAANNMIKKNKVTIVGEVKDEKRESEPKKDTKKGN